MSIESGLNQDFLDVLEAFASAEVEFLVVGAHAMAVHGVPRAMGDLDLWVRPTALNAARVWSALKTFGAHLSQHGVSVGDFETPGNVYQLGLPPRRIDVLTQISGVTFEAAWQTRLELSLQNHP